MDILFAPLLPCDVKTLVSAYLKANPMENHKDSLKIIFGWIYSQPNSTITAIKAECDKNYSRQTFTMVREEVAV